MSRRWWRIARAGGALFHTDAVQAAGKIPIDVAALGVDALTVSAHKLDGPKGVGAIFIRRGAPFEPPTRGGHQERERRPGTENVAGIVGFGVAARIALAELAGSAARISALRDRLLDAAARHAGSPPARRSADGAAGNAQRRIRRRPGAAGRGRRSISKGSPSRRAPPARRVRSSRHPCLLALGLPREEAAWGLRFSLGRDTTAEEIDRVAALVAEIVARVRRRGAPGAVVSTGGGRERIVVAMSGGVDSSTAAAVLVDAGYDVVGVTLQALRRERARRPASAGAAAGRATSRTRARRPRSSASRTT